MKHLCRLIGGAEDLASLLREDAELSLLKRSPRMKGRKKSKIQTVGDNYPLFSSLSLAIKVAPNKSTKGGTFSFSAIVCFGREEICEA